MYAVLSESHLISPKPYLSNAIDFARDIAPYRWISIWAGVGAGKNSFAEKLISGCPREGIPKMTVLIITSRRAKVLETLSNASREITDIFDDIRSVRDIFYNTDYQLEDFEKNI